MTTGLKNIKLSLRRYQDIDGDEALENPEEGGLDNDELEDDLEEKEEDDPTEDDGGLEE